MDKERISTIFIAILAVLTGTLSYFVSLRTPNNLYVFVMGLILLYVSLFADSKLIKKTKFKLKLNQDFFVFFLIWLVSWSFYMNLYL
jgi:hypothetical protein